MSRFIVVCFLAGYVNVDVTALYTSLENASDSNPSSSESVHNSYGSPIALSTYQDSVRITESVPHHGYYVSKFGDEKSYAYESSINQNTPPNSADFDNMKSKYSPMIQSTSFTQQYYDGLGHPTESSIAARIAFTNPSVEKMEADARYARNKAKYDTIWNPADESETKFQKWKSFMHYRPPREATTQYNYDSFHSFHADDDDVRTSSRSPYESWPLVLTPPYAYEHIKHVDTPKDKRFVVDSDYRVIPVHEYHENDWPNQQSSHAETSTMDNPMSGHQPFFSFVIRDYFDKPIKAEDDDPVNFSGLRGLDDDYYFDSSVVHKDDDFGKRNRRLPDNRGVNHEEAEKGFSKDRKYDQHESAKHHGSKDHESSVQQNNQHKGFKDFVDAFVNKFGAEDHKKHANYATQKKQDKGEKKNGFHRVYHKDEYQMNNEFYDNNSVKAHGEENGSSTAHNKGSEALLKSHAAAATGNNSNTSKKASSSDRNNYEHNTNGYQTVKGLDKDFNRYRDIARDAALVNNADYLLHD